MGHALKIGVVGGGGWLGQAIIKAMLRSGVIHAKDLAISYRSKPPEDVGAALITPDSQALIDACETIILSVRPADWPKLSISAHGRLVISVMAGVPMEWTAPLW